MEKLAQEGKYLINYGDYSEGEQELIDSIEEKYESLFIAAMTVKTKNGAWSEEPVYVFYQPNPEPTHSNYFGIFKSHGTFYITNAVSAFSEPITAMVSPKTNEVVFSRWRHDNRSTRDGEVSVDGGRDYLRCSGAGKTIQLHVQENRLVPVEEIFVEPEPKKEELPPYEEQSLQEKLRIRAKIRRIAVTRKSVQENKNDRLCSLLDEAADRIDELERKLRGG